MSFYCLLVLCDHVVVVDPSPLHPAYIHTVFRREQHLLNIFMCNAEADITQTSQLHLTHETHSTIQSHTTTHAPQLPHSNTHAQPNEKNAHAEKHTGKLAPEYSISAATFLNVLAQANLYIPVTRGSPRHLPAPHPTTSNHEIARVPSEPHAQLSGTLTQANKTSSLGVLSKKDAQVSDLACNRNRAELLVRVILDGSAGKVSMRLDIRSLNLPSVYCLFFVVFCLANR